VRCISVAWHRGGPAGRALHSLGLAQPAPLCESYQSCACSVARVQGWQASCALRAEPANKQTGQPHTTPSPPPLTCTLSPAPAYLPACPQDKWGSKYDRIQPGNVHAFIETAAIAQEKADKKAATAARRKSTAAARRKSAGGDGDGESSKRKTAAGKKVRLRGRAMGGLWAGQREKGRVGHACCILSHAHSLASSKAAHVLVTFFHLCCLSSSSPPTCPS